MTLEYEFGEEESIKVSALTDLRPETTRPELVRLVNTWFDQSIGRELAFFTPSPLEANIETLEDLPTPPGMLIIGNHCPPKTTYTTTTTSISDTTTTTSISDTTTTTTPIADTTIINCSHVKITILLNSNTSYSIIDTLPTPSFIQLVFY